MWQNCTITSGMRNFKFSTPIYTAAVFIALILHTHHKGYNKRLKALTQQTGEDKWLNSRPKEESWSSTCSHRVDVQLRRLQGNSSSGSLEHMLILAGISTNVSGSSWWDRKSLFYASNHNWGTYRQINKRWNVMKYLPLNIIGTFSDSLGR